MSDIKTKTERDNRFEPTEPKTSFFDLTPSQIESLKACSISSLDESEYTGKIESLGKYYAIQNVSDTEVILHHLSLFNFELPLSHNVTIKYQNGVSSLKSIT